MAGRLQLTDVTLRDGLQMESRQFSSEDKLQLLGAIAKLKPSRIELTSFVSPKWVPQFSDSREFCEKAFQSDLLKGVETMAFVPNEKGVDRLLETPIQWAAGFVAVSESFNKKNVNRSVAESVEALGAVLSKVKAAGRKSRVYVSTVFGCPYEGSIAVDAVKKVVEKVAAFGPDEIALSDTIGVATPSQVEDILKMSLPIVPAEKTALHFHNTYGMALSCAERAAQLGVTHFDGALGGTGGCPYAKGASGNVPIEQLMYLFAREGSWTLDSTALKNGFEVLDGLGLNAASSLSEIKKKGGEWYGI